MYIYIYVYIYILEYRSLRSQILTLRQRCRMFSCMSVCVSLTKSLQRQRRARIRECSDRYSSIYIYTYIYVAAHQYFALCIISAACDAQHTAHYKSSSTSKNKRSTSQKCMRSLTLLNIPFQLLPAGTIIPFIVTAIFCSHGHRSQQQRMYGLRLQNIFVA